jgi:multiple sugar transport system permease protein
MAAATIAIVPLALLFIASQRHIVASIVLSGVK